MNRFKIVRNVSARLLAVTLFASILGLSVNEAAHGEQSTEIAWKMPRDTQLGNQIFTLPGEPIGDIRSYLFRSSFVSMVDKEDPTCSNFSDAKCSGTQFSYRAVIPNCDSATVLDCISSLEIAEGSGGKQKAEFLGYFPKKSQNAFTGDADAGIPTGASGSLFQVTNASGNKDIYFVAAMIDGGGTKNSHSRYAIESRIYRVRQVPVTFILGSKDNGIVQVDTEKVFAGMPLGTYIWQSPGYNEDLNCIVTSVAESSCLERLSLNSNVRISLNLKLKSIPNGWMHGRLLDPAISIEELVKSKSVTVTANPIVVPVYYKKYSWTELPTQVREKYDLKTGKYLGGEIGFGAYSPPNDDPLKRSIIIDPPAYSPQASDQLNLWLRFTGDKATAEQTMWNFHTLTSQETLGANKCFTSAEKVTGIVTTNSATYSAGPPEFDATSEALNYKVSAPHFSSSGDLFKGSYDLILSEEVSKCLYGFAGASAKATISVTTTEGAQQIATTSFTNEGGWMHLSAKGFTFSSPTIKIKLSKEDPPKVEVPKQESVPEKVGSAVVAKKSSITCVKGKVTKKVTAVKPKCPTGYKKK
jgi:hypothetical protein